MADRAFCGVVAINLMFGVARTVILVGLPVFTVQVLEAPAWLAGALYATYTAMIAFGQTSMVRQLEGHRRTRALMLAAVLWAMSFLLLAVASSATDGCPGGFSVRSDRALPSRSCFRRRD